MNCTDKYSQHISIIWTGWLNGRVFVYVLSGFIKTNDKVPDDSTLKTFHIN